MLTYVPYRSVMGPTKRPQAIESASVKRKKDLNKCRDLQETHETDSVGINSNDDPVKSYLLQLPNEVLLHIYRYLSPADLSSLSELNNEKLTGVTYMIREVNVSSCRRDNPILVSSYFSRMRAKYIQKLNFNYCFSIKPQELANLICRCKNLTTLSVVECGLTHNNIINILRCCTKLEELAWFVGEVKESFNICCPNMKRLYLFSDISGASMDYIHLFLSIRFPKIENVWINFAPDCVSALPFIGPWLKSSFGKSCSTELTKQLILTENCSDILTYNCGLAIFSKVFDKETVEKCVKHFYSVLFNDSKISKFGKVYNNPPHLQIRSIEEDIAMLSSGPFNAYSVVAILLTSDIINVSKSLVKCIQEISGDRLRHFSLQQEVQEDMPLLDEEETITACDMLEKLFLTSKNITVLNLTAVHFNKGSPIKAITQLANLKVLNIPSCAFGNHAKVEHHQSFELSVVVSSCRKIEDFTLNCCDKSSEQFREEDIVCLKDWFHLKHLTFYSAVFRTNFLRKVADSCMLLQSLSLVTEVPNNACLYTNDVIYVLQRAKNLRLIRINEKRFSPMFERFWAAIGEAVNLEGICIITESSSPIMKRTVISAIKKLKYLHLFHFYAPKATDGLYRDVKKSMRELGIKNINVISRPTTAHEKLFPHERPHYCCSHLHLKQLDIF